MLFSEFKAFARMLSIYAICSGALLPAECAVDEVIVRGRVEDAPVKGSVRVQLVYQNQKVADSAEATLEGESFRIQVPFLTQSHAPGLLGLREKCDRKPTTVVVVLVKGDQEYDRVSLDLAQDFKMADSSTYGLRSEILLHGPPNKPVR